MRVYDPQSKARILECLSGMVRAVEDDVLRHPIDFGLCCQRLAKILEDAEECPIHYFNSNPSPYDNPIHQFFIDGLYDFAFSEDDELFPYIFPSHVPVKPSTKRPRKSKPRSTKKSTPKPKLKTVG